MEYRFYSVTAQYLGSQEADERGVLKPGDFISREFPGRVQSTWEVLAVSARTDGSVIVMVTPVLRSIDSQCGRPEVQGV